MTRRMLLWMMICMLLTGALAEAGALSVWANGEDFYYHSDLDCGGISPRYALSAGAAEAFGLTPCPQCMAEAPEAAPEPEPEDVPVPRSRIVCAERGGTWVFQIPQAVLDGIELGDNPAPEGAAALVALYGEHLTDALDARLAVPADDALCMSLRAIDGDAWVVMRPKKDYKAKRPFRWVVERVAAELFAPGAYSVSGVSDVMEYVPEDEDADMERMLELDDDGLHVDVYGNGSMYIAVLRRDAGDDEPLTGIVRVDGMDSAIPVEGYVSKGKAVYCFPLSGDEVKALSTGAACALIPEESPAPEAADSGDDEGDFRPVATLPPEASPSPTATYDPFSAYDASDPYAAYGAALPDAAALPEATYDPFAPDAAATLG